MTEQITMWKTKYGKVFASFEEAHEDETLCEVKSEIEFLLEHYYPGMYREDRLTSDDILTFILDNKDFLRTQLNRLPVKD